MAIKICPPVCECQLLRQPGAKVTFAIGTLSSFSLVTADNHTSPVKFGLGESFEPNGYGCLKESAVCAVANAENVTATTAVKILFFIHIFKKTFFRVI